MPRVTNRLMSTVIIKTPGVLIKHRDDLVRTCCRHSRCSHGVQYMNTAYVR